MGHDVAQATAKGMQRVMDLGAQDVLGIATCMGTGALASHDPDKGVVLDVQGEGLMGGIRAAEDAYQSLPAPVLERIEAFDPRREAGVLRPPFAVNPSVAGRRVFGIRPPNARPWRTRSSSTPSGTRRASLGLRTGWSRWPRPRR